MRLTEQLHPLRKALARHFNLAELNTLCFDLGIDYEELAGATKTEKVTALLDYCERHGRLPALLTHLQAERPQIDWVAYHIDETTIVASPFKGLQYFDTTDADLFFGREELTAELVGRLRRENFLAVIGASGSGKSSLVRAGLLPALAAGRPLPGSEQWPVHLITPGVHPLKELAASLTADTLSTAATTTLIDDLRRDARTLDLAAAKLLVQRGQAAHLFLVVDQFEELFTLCTDETERQSFIDNLMTAVSPETGGPTIVVITLRADFYDRCDPYPHLRDAVAAHQKFIGAMNRAEMRRAIEEPALRRGYTFEPGLVDLILADMQADETRPPDPGTLPLLSHALQETWRRRDGRTLTLQGYTAAGQVQGAIAQTAESEFRQLLPEEQALARRLFLRLIDLDERTEPTRRQATRLELLPSGPAAALTSDVLTDLTDARLLTVDQNEQGEELVNIVHEALVRRWPRLQTWLETDREAIILRHRLMDAAREWEQSGREASYLFHGTRLARIEETFPVAELSAQEQAFVAASQTAVAASQTAVATSRRRRNWLLVGLVGLVVLLGIAATAVWRTQQSPWQTLYDANPVFSLAAASGAAPQYYLGTRDLGVGRSRNGRDWVVSMDGLPLGSSGEFARAVSRLTSDRQNADYLLAYIAGNGVFASTDGGAAWQDASGQADGALPQTDFIDLAAWDSWLWVVAKGDAPADLYVSQDGGQRWQPAQDLACEGAVGEARKPEGVTAVYVSADGAMVYAGAAGGLYSTPRQPCWSWQRLADIPPVLLIAGNRAAPETLYLETPDPNAETNGRIYRWSVGGAAELLATVTQNEPLALAPHPDPKATTAVYALLANGEVIAVSQSGEFRPIDQVSDLSFDLLAVPNPGGEGVQLWLAHMDGLLALTDDGR